MIIGITGLAGAGKDTFADGILKQDVRYIKLKNAMLLKDIVSIIFSWNRDWLEGETVESREWRNQVDEYWNERVIDELKPFTPRKALQYIGTELGRKLISPSLWVAGLEKYITDNNLPNVVISDVRFKEELNMIKRLGGIVVEITRDTPDWYSTILAYRTGVLDISSEQYTQILSQHHASETDWIGSPLIDCRIFNDKDISHLHNVAKTFITDPFNYIC